MVESTDALRERVGNGGFSRGVPCREVVQFLRRSQHALSVLWHVAWDGMVTGAVPTVLCSVADEAASWRDVGAVFAMQEHVCRTGR